MPDFYYAVCSTWKCQAPWRLDSSIVDLALVCEADEGKKQQQTMRQVLNSNFPMAP